MLFAGDRRQRGPEGGRTCAEGEEEELHLLTFGQQLDEVELEGDRVNAVLRDHSFCCRGRAHGQRVTTHRFGSSVNFDAHVWS